MGLPLQLFKGPPPSQNPPICASLVRVIPQISIHRVDEEIDLRDSSRKPLQHLFDRFARQVRSVRGKVTVYLTGEDEDEDENDEEDGMELHAKALGAEYRV